MKRGPSGRYLVSAEGGEEVRSFVPAHLPPTPAVVLNGPVNRALEPALLALGRLDAVSTLLPDTAVFLYAYVRKEALLSSQIEGTQSSISELLLSELDEAPGVPTDDVVEVSNYVAAMEHGLKRLKEGFPLSNRLIREIHGVLLQKGRGSNKDPGEFRTTQNWIGGTRPGNARFVPCPASEVHSGMGALELFLHDKSIELPLLIRAALVHVQFETVHPFLDGNGRVGRLLITLQLYHAGVLHEPLLYLSLYLKRNRDRYYDLLDRVRKDGVWEEWLVFFLDGIRETAEEAVGTAQRLVRMFDKDRELLAPLGRKAHSALQVLELLKKRPVTSIGFAAKQTRLSYPTVQNAVDLLIRRGVVRELTGRQRNRVFGYDGYLKILSEGTEPV